MRRIVYTVIVLSPVNRKCEVISVQLTIFEINACAKAMIHIFVFIIVTIKHTHRRIVQRRKVQAMNVQLHTPSCTVGTQFTVIYCWRMCVRRCVPSVDLLIQMLVHTAREVAY